jgi:hypothetical protein
MVLFGLKLLLLYVFKEVHTLVVMDDQFMHDFVERL